MMISRSLSSFAPFFLGSRLKNAFFDLLLFGQSYQFNRIHCLPFLNRLQIDGDFPYKIFICYT